MKISSWFSAVCFCFFSVDKMRDSLIKFPSFKIVKRSTKHASNHADDEMNVFASDIVSTAFILDSLRDVRQNLTIVKLEIEDLLIANNHHSFLPVVKELLANDNRPWKYLKFIDTIDGSDMLWWQGMKHTLMREYEATIDDKTKYAGIVSFQANIQINAGANKRYIHSLVKTIGGDLDLQQVNFSGALFGYSNDTLPGALAKLFDNEGCLQEGFVITVNSGWTSPHDHDSSCCVLEVFKEVLHGDYCKSHDEVKKDTRHGRCCSGNDDVLSLNSAHGTLSGTSHHSSRSDGTRRTPQQRTPRRARSNDVPIIVQGPPTQHSLNLPKPSVSKVNARTRSVPLRSKSLNTKPSSKLADRSDTATDGETEVKGSSKTIQRTKSFQHRHLMAECLSVKKNYGEDEQKGYRPPNGNGQDRSLPRNPAPTVPSRRNSFRSLASSKSKLCLCHAKSLDQDNLGETTHSCMGCKNHGYDWKLIYLAEKVVAPHCVHRSLSGTSQHRSRFDGNRRTPRRAKSLESPSAMQGSPARCKPSNGNGKDSPVPRKPVQTVSSTSLLGPLPYSKSTQCLTESLDKDVLDRTEHGNTGCNNPDFDWTKGDLAEKTVSPCAA
jgi:hypothetical protein